MSLTGVSEVAELARDVIDKIFPDKSEQERIQLAQISTIISGQLDANKVEASSSSLFVSGWRPFIGWVCGVGFAIQSLGPLLEWLAMLFSHTVKFPVMDLSEMMPLLIGMLGLGGLRSYDKVKGVASK